MFHPSCIRAFCFLLIAQTKIQFTVARDEEGLRRRVLTQRPTSGEYEVLDKLKHGIFDYSRALKGKRSEIDPPFLNNLNGSSLKDLASRVTEILDRISKNWALEGAKTIQNGEIRLRKLNKNLTEKISELITNGSKYGRHVSSCMNKTVFEIGLERILEETTGCYSKSLLSVERQLKKIEDEEGAVLERMENYGISMFDRLSGCFLKESVPGVIECLQEVDGTDIGSHTRDREAMDLIMEISGFVNDIPRAFSSCTSKSLVETEALVRKGYAQSLTCLQEHIT